MFSLAWVNKRFVLFTDFVRFETLIVNFTNVQTKSIFDNLFFHPKKKNSEHKLQDQKKM